MNNTTILIKDFRDWEFIGDIDLMICDIPFGIKFDGKASNYNRKLTIEDGYVEWTYSNLHSNLLDLLSSAKKYLKNSGNLLIFTGWQMSKHLSYVIQNLDEQNQELLKFRGKLYWAYNFAPFCKNKPSHNIYEIYWFSKKKKSFYSNICSLDHCMKGEKNLSLIQIKRNYIKNIKKYPTRLPINLIRVLIEHFSPKNSLIFDPFAGSGTTKIAVDLFYPLRECYAGDLNPNSPKIYQIYKKYYEKNLEK